MLIDCDVCAVRGAACQGCLVSVVLGAPPAGLDLNPAERRAVEVLADAGMVPRLRLVTAGTGPAGPAAERAGPAAGPARRARRIA